MEDFEVIGRENQKKKKNHQSTYFIKIQNNYEISNNKFII